MAVQLVEFRVRATGDAEASLAATAAAARDAAEAERALAGAAEQAAAAQRAQAAAGRQVADTANVSSGAVQNLRFQLFDIGQGLATGVNPLVILAQQGPQVAQAMMGAGAGVGALKAAVMGLVAPAVAAASVLAPLAILAGGVVLYRGEMERLAEVAAETEKALTAAADAVSRMGERTADSVTQMKLALGLVTPEVVRHGEQVAKIKDDYAVAAAAIEEQIETLKATTPEWGSRVAALRAEKDALKASTLEAITAADGQLELAQAMRGASEHVAENEKRLREQAAASRVATAEAERLARAQAAAAKSAAEYERTHLRVTMMLVDLEAALFDAEAVLPAASGAFADLANELDGLVPPRALTDLEKLADLGDRVREAFATGQIDAEQYAALTEAIGRGQASVSTGGAVTGTGVAATVAGAVSNPLVTIANVHPIAAAIVAGVQAAATGGSAITDAADLVMQAIDSLDEVVQSAFSAAARLVGEAPAALVRALPGVVRSLVEGIPAVIHALVTTIPDVVVALAEALPAMIPDLALAFVEAVVLAGPALAIGITAALVSAFLDPALYAAIGDAFVAGFERAWASLVGIVEDFLRSIGLISDEASASPTIFEGAWWEQAGQDIEQAGRDVSRAVAGESSSSRSSSSTTIRLDGRDFVSDFDRAINLESGSMGRNTG